MDHRAANCCVQREEKVAKLIDKMLRQEGEAKTRQKLQDVVERTVKAEAERLKRKQHKKKEKGRFKISNP